MSDIIEVYDPGNRELVGTVPSASREDVEQVLATASKASDIARNMPTHLRISVLRQVAEQLLKRHEEFARVIAREGIKTLRQARKEVSRCIETLRLSAEEARRRARRRDTASHIFSSRPVTNFLVKVARRLQMTTPSAVAVIENMRS